MEHVLSLDLSTKRSGWAYYEAADCTIQYGVIASSAADVEKRIGVMSDGIIDLLKKFKVDTIVIEEVRPDGYNNHTGKVLTWLQGVIAVAVYEYDKHIKVEFIGASSWRSKLGLQGYRIQRDQQKKKDIEYANMRYGLSLTSEQDDEADALCILTAFVAGGPEPKAQRLGPIGSDESAF